MGMSRRRLRYRAWICLSIGLLVVVIVGRMLAIASPLLSGLWSAPE